MVSQLTCPHCGEQCVVEVIGDKQVGFYCEHCNAEFDNDGGEA
jgi:transposase-like protein